MSKRHHRLDRRSFLQLGAAAGALSALPPAFGSAGGAFAAEADATVKHTLVARPARVAVAGAPYPDTLAWTYDGRLPGPTLRVRQGSRFQVELVNELAEDTTVHWHGIRLPIEMDGVPYLSQPPVPPGGRFLYDFVVPDAGTFWYHSHVNSGEQIGRGLSGALVVEEREPVAVDRDEVWVLSDMRLTRDAVIDDFGRFRDAAHGGRIGNTVTVNGRMRDTFRVRAGERL
ncbi:MAG TPA: multicopper oxidase domain-containing protein, partial [Arenibaculum sp.]|nr:multicopper oxidase domain-containing protein [Arenibaculum sp.]